MVPLRLTVVRYCLTVEFLEVAPRWLVVNSHAAWTMRILALIHYQVVLLHRYLTLVGRWAVRIRHHIYFRNVIDRFRLATTRPVKVILQRRLSLILLYARWHINQRWQRLFQMLWHCFNRLVHHQVRVLNQVLMLNIEELFGIKLLVNLEHLVNLIHHEVIFFNSLWFLSCFLQSLQCLSSFVPEEVPTHMTLDLLSHLVSFSLA